MWQRLIFFILLLSSVSAQSFFYSYVDPCEQTVVRSNYTLNSEQQGFQVTYYNRTKFFTLEEVLDGQLELWTQSVFKDFDLSDQTYLKHLSGRIRGAFVGVPYFRLINVR